MKPAKRVINRIEQLTLCWRRLLHLLRTHPAVQHWDLEHRYMRNAYAKFPGLRRTIIFWWLESFLLWAIPLVLFQHLPLLLRAMLVPLWIVWFFVAYHIYQLDAKVMACCREARQRSRFFRAEILKRTHSQR